MSSYGTNPGANNSGNESFEPYAFGDFAGSFDETDTLKPSAAGGSGGLAGDLSSVTIPIAPAVSGNMGGGPSGSSGRATLDTLDEPVWDTIKRDMLSIWAKLRHVLLPRKDNANILKDWDLWGPLLLCLALSLRLGITAADGQAPAVFTAIFVIVWCGAAAVTLNSKLLGGKM
ncbi:hypothetical protein HKX48_005251 [Thoreauomyces humboldtii]|nr:hypothetical protein HKX48_005251 [Thoreauomyces humboldtii]